MKKYEWGKKGNVSDPFGSIKERSMSNEHWLSKAIGTIGLILTLGTSMNAEAGFFGLFGGGQKWKEEIRLSDGRVIVVDRELISEGGGDEWASNRSGSKPKEYVIRFTHPDGSGKTVEWRSTKKDFQTWPEIALVLDVEAGQPIVFSIVAISAGCEIYSKYIYKNGVWTEETLPESFEQRTTNLFLRLGTDMPKFVNLETKQKINSGSEGRGYRRALRQIGPNRKVCG